MQAIEDIAVVVPSKLADLRDVPLAEMPTLSRATLDETLSRVVTGPEQVAPVPVAAFQSAI
jgi:FXSXX-COOH protein